MLLRHLPLLLAPLAVSGQHDECYPDDAACEVSTDVLLQSKRQAAPPDAGTSSSAGEDEEVSAEAVRGRILFQLRRETLESWRIGVDSQEGEADPCTAVWSTPACAGGACHSCGARISWLKSALAKSDAEARKMVSDEFPGECGPCGRSGSSGRTCEQQLDTPACVGAACFTCRQRIEWLNQHRQLSILAARAAVAKEFPSECGACGGGSGGAGSPGVSYRHFKDKNVWVGHGAEEGLNDQAPPRGKTAAQCQALCTANSACDCVTFHPGGGICWLRRGCQVDAGSPTSSGYDVYVKQGGPVPPDVGTPAPVPQPAPARVPQLAPSPAQGPPAPKPAPVPMSQEPCQGPAAADVCNVPQGHCATLSGHKFCSQVSVWGGLSLADGAKLQTQYLRVHSTGTLIVGSPNAPAKDVEIILQHTGELKSDGQVYIHGEEKTSWTWLKAECDYCRTIQVNECKGWKVGDHIVLVGTGNGQNGQVQANQQYRTDERRIQSMSGCSITLDRNADQKHRCEMYKGKVNINSEVLNMDRSVRIFGHSQNFANGVRVRQQFGGVMQINYARVSNCGQRKLGEYCLHFHHVGPCPECSFVGNAVGWPSVNKGITVHGTSNSRVEHNVIYDHRGAFLYVEDGNEIGNHINSNALVCPRKAPHCVLNDGINEHKASDQAEQAGMYVVSATNDFIGNHISGMENAFFHDFQGGSKVWGGGDKHSGNTFKKICPSANPFRKISWNYFHNNQGFGFYHPHSAFPTRVQTNERGYVTDWNTCLGFDPVTGEDNSAETLVENHVELFHNFGAGGYDGGETSFRNAVFAFGLAANYYKTFRRGVRSGPFCEGCFYTNNLYPNGPGGSCMWEYKDTVFEDTLYSLNINHHCGNNGEWTGGLCASHFWFTGSSDWKGEFKIHNDGFDAAKGYSDSIVHLKGWTYFGTNSAHPAFRTHECQRGKAGGHFTACQADNIRIVRIYSADRGQIMVRNNNEGHTVHVPYTPWKKHPWGRPNAYDLATKYQNGGMGYTFLVKAGHSYTITVHGHSHMPDFFTLEYSDIQMPKDSITLSVQGGGAIAGPACAIQSSHSRNWISPYGPYVPQSGAWYDCLKWNVHYTIAQHAEKQRQHFRAHGVQI